MQNIEGYIQIGRWNAIA